MYTNIHTIICEKKMQQIIHRPNTQCHGCANGCLGWYPVVADRLLCLCSVCVCVCVCSPGELCLSSS